MMIDTLRYSLWHGVVIADQIELISPLRTLFGIYNTLADELIVLCKHFSDISFKIDLEVIKGGWLTYISSIVILNILPFVFFSQKYQ